MSISQSQKPGLVLLLLFNEHKLNLFSPIKPTVRVVENHPDTLGLDVTSTPSHPQSLNESLPSDKTESPGMQYYNALIKSRSLCERMSSATTKIGRYRESICLAVIKALRESLTPTIILHSFRQAGLADDACMEACVKRMRSLQMKVMKEELKEYSLTADDFQSKYVLKAETVEMVVDDGDGVEDGKMRVISDEASPRVVENTEHIQKKKTEGGGETEEAEQTEKRKCEREAMEDDIQKMKGEAKEDLTTQTKTENVEDIQKKKNGSKARKTSHSENTTLTTSDAALSYNLPRSAPPRSPHLLRKTLPSTGLDSLISSDSDTEDYSFLLSNLRSGRRHRIPRSYSPTYLLEDLVPPSKQSKPFIRNKTFHSLPN